MGSQRTSTLPIDRHSMASFATSVHRMEIAILVGCSFLNHYAVDAREALNKDLLQPSKVPFLTRLNEVTNEEVWTRLVVALSSWTMFYFLLQELFSVPAAIAVILKPSSVAEWRPMFGPVSEIYTMRGFWG